MSQLFVPLIKSYLHVSMSHCLMSKKSNSIDKGQLSKCFLCLWKISHFRNEWAKYWHEVSLFAPKNAQDCNFYYQFRLSKWHQWVNVVLDSQIMRVTWQEIFSYPLCVPIESSLSQIKNSTLSLEENVLKIKSSFPSFTFSRRRMPESESKK